MTIGRASRETCLTPAVGWPEWHRDDGRTFFRGLVETVKGLTKELGMNENHVEKSVCYYVAAETECSMPTIVKVLRGEHTLASTRKTILAALARHGVDVDALPKPIVLMRQDTDGVVTGRR